MFSIFLKHFQTLLQHSDLVLLPDEDPPGGGEVHQHLPQPRVGAEVAWDAIIPGKVEGVAVSNVDFSTFNFQLGSKI